MRSVRGLPHLKRLDDCFGDFLVRVQQAELQDMRSQLADLRRATQERSH